MAADDIAEALDQARMLAELDEAHAGSVVEAHAIVTTRALLGVLSAERERVERLRAVARAGWAVSVEGVLTHALLAPRLDDALDALQPGDTE